MNGQIGLNRRAVNGTKVFIGGVWSHLALTPSDVPYIAGYPWSQTLDNFLEAKGAGLPLRESTSLSPALLVPASKRTRPIAL